MTMNISKGNMYDFVTHTWNAIKGECPHGCAYCYMKTWAKQKPARLDRSEFKTDLGSGNFIFVGSSCDMFAESIQDEWIKETMEHCIKFDNRYLFQSKNPINMIKWLRIAKLRGQIDPVVCTTIETNRWYPEIMRHSPTAHHRSTWMGRDEILEHYVTIEPIMDFDLDEMVRLIKNCNPVQVNIGANTSRKVTLPEPPAEKVIELIGELKKFTTIHKKSNLKRLGI